VSSGTSDVLGFESVADWALDPSDSGATTIVGLNPGRTQGESSLEVTAQNFARLNSVPMSSIGSIGSLVLLDIQLPTSQANPSWFGDAQMFVSSPSLGINNVPLGDVPMTGLALGTWETLAFQVPPATAATIAHGVYSDLTFSVVLNVPFNETGHYLLDNIRSIPDVIPSLLGIAQDGTALKAVFDYQTTASTPVNIPYGTANGLTNQSGFIAAPPEVPPSTFVPTTHAPFVATLSGSILTWTVGSHSATATPQATKLSVTTLGDGTHDATLPDGRKINLDTVAPQNPTAGGEPGVGAHFNGQLTGQLTVSPSGAAVYTVPIVIPPGVAGMAPNLSLVYNSQGGDGIAGQGWDLAGLSTINRCQRTRADDGYGRPVMLDALDSPTGGDTDGICLDGAKLVEDPQNPGSYTPQKTDFSKIVRNGNVFTVTAKSGETRYYGLNPLDTVTATGSLGTGTAAWLLDRVVDVWGNYYDLHYNEGNGDFTTSGLRVSEIDYTGHLTGSTTDVPTFSSVKFGYELRPDIRWSRIGQTKIPKNRRLTSITTPRGTYSLSYDFQGSPTRLLQTISYCPGTSCSQPLTLAFNWQSSNYTWSSAAASGYVLPTDVGFGQGLVGTQFVDVDGDGRPDLVIGRKDGGNGIPQQEIYQNTGSGWALMTGPGGAFPTLLNGPAGVRFADIDGDGVLDLIQDSAQVGCTSTSCVACVSGKPCTGTITGSSPAVWLNRVPKGGGWEFHSEYNSPGAPGFFANGGPLEFNGADPVFLSDLDGDGKPDLVHPSSGLGQALIGVLMNRGPGIGWSTPNAQSTIRTPGSPVSPDGPAHFVLSDVNRDGLPDVVSQEYYILPNSGGNGTESFITTAQTVLLNRGPDSTGAISFGPPVTRGSGAGLSPVTVAQTIASGDIDGDGFYDLATYYSLFGINGNTTLAPFLSGVGFGDGTGSSFTADDSQGYNAAFLADQPTPVGPDPDIDAVEEDFRFALVDIDGDGLVDLVRNHFNRTTGPNAGLGGGEVRFNTGTGWGDGSPWRFWAGPNAVPGEVPMDLPTPHPSSTVDHGSAFVDLDGDGIVDFIQEEEPRGAWINTTKRPEIVGFPNALAAPSQVVYSAITQNTAPLYIDDLPVAPGTKVFMVPVRVVSTVTTENGAGALSSAQYIYHSLRRDPNGRGPLGFSAVEIHDGASGVITTTTYALAYPYTGLPTSVTRGKSIPSNNPAALSSTTTQYCDSLSPTCPATTTVYPPGKSVFVFPKLVTDSANAEPGDPEQLLTTTVAYQYDTAGNPIATVVSTTKQNGQQSQIFSKQTTNTYGTPGSQEEQQGKLTQAIMMSSSVTSPFPAPETTTPTLTHTTTFSYSPVSGFGGFSSTALALTKKRVEPAAGWPLEVDTAYAYDRFGNALTTTECANDFDSCVAGASGPSGSTDPQHRPFRTTTVSYDPATFNAPAGTGLAPVLNYSIGRFPVKTTNALGQSEYTAYDPVKGVLLQKTGPNGISTCYTYDDIGRETSEVARCGSAVPLVTTMDYFLTLPTSPICFPDPTVCSAFAPSPPRSKTVTVTRPPSGTATWAYLDDEGQSAGTISRGFDGSLVETFTQYNALNQVAQVAKPFVTSANPSLTISTYDTFNRPFQIIDHLGAINASTTDTISTVTTTYGAFGIATNRAVNGQTETHFETKNAIGKLEIASDTGSGTVTYGYDSDGNLTTTQENSNQVTVQMDYDTRGRKISSIDPDMGTWHYVFDGFGDLVSQTDAKGQTTTMSYDVLGRMISKTDPGGTAQWVYDVAQGAGIGRLAAQISEPDLGLAGPCSVPYVTLTDGKRSGLSFAYDQFGELVQESQCTDGDMFVTTYEYDSLGRQSLVRYPAVHQSQLAVGYHYTSLGYLQYLTDESTDYGVLWQAKSMNALGQVTDEQMRNGVETVSNRNASTGWLMGSTSTAHADGNNVIQNWVYTFDEVGNLLTRGRSDAVNPVSSAESFTYDQINRVLTSSVTLSAGAQPPPDSYVYDPLGNLTQKSGNLYTYGTGCAAGSPAGPHAVCTVASGTPFSYDGNGNLVAGNNRTITYNAMNKVVQIDSDAPSAAASVGFIYSSDGDRVVQAATSAGATARTVYVGLGATGKSLYERTTTTTTMPNATTTQYVNFIYAGGAHNGAAFALRVLTDNGTPTATKYYNFDHLGSVTAMSDEEGRVVSDALGGPNATVFGYDPWGARRKPDGEAASAASFTPQVGHREFTGQETIPSVGLVNMNGRVYDPALGRFLSPDPNIQRPSDLQSYNRYSYVENNPLKYTDPTGYFWGLHNNFSTWLEVGEFVVGTALCIWDPGACILVGMGIALLNATVSLAEGEPFNEVEETFEISIDLNLATAGIGQEIGGGPVAAVLGGGLSGAAGTALDSLVTGQSLGWNVLDGAAIGAVTAGIAWETGHLIAVSQADAAAAKGGGGSGEAQLTTNQVSSYEVAGYKCDQCNAPDLDIYPDGPGPLGVPLLRDPISGVLDFAAALAIDPPGLGSSLQPADLFFVGKGLLLAGGMVIVGLGDASLAEGPAVFLDGSIGRANVQIAVGAGEFSNTLMENGFQWVGIGEAVNGPFATFASGDLAYTVYTATSTGQASAEVFLSGSSVLKYRLSGW
jgi:RHS repeat-associated protein